jgi:Fic family protein
MKLSEILRASRKSKSLTFSLLSILTGIDSGLLNKYEKGDRLPSKRHLSQLILGLELTEEEARTAWLAERVYAILEDEEYSIKAMQVAESRVRYNLEERTKFASDIPSDLKEILTSCDEMLSEWDSFKPLNATRLRKMEEYFHLNYTYESNRIEGNTLTLQETLLVIKDGITIGGKSVREHLEAINHSEAVDYIKEVVQGKIELTERLLKHIHYLVLKAIDKENAGTYRSVGVRISGSTHIPPEPFLLTRLMEEVFEFYEKNKKIMHPIILAAEMHERIVHIHPFIDGNGRTTRLVMNLILLQNGFPIGNIKGERSARINYYAALEKAPTDNRHDFHLLIARTVEESLKEHIELSK